MSRTELLVIVRRLSSLIGRAHRDGPDGSLEGKFAQEHPRFVHYSNAIYLAGCLAFMEGRDGKFSWNHSGAAYPNFDSYAAVEPKDPNRNKESFAARGITNSALNALVCIRNAVTHNADDLAKNLDKKSLAKVQGANLPGVELSGSVVTLKPAFLDFVRVATVAVRRYHGES